MRVLWIVVRVIIFVFLPAVLAYLGSEKNLIDLLKEKHILGDGFNVSWAKQFSLVASITISNLILMAMFEYKNYKLSLTLAENLSLTTDFKTAFLSALANQLEDPHVNSIKFRVWREEKGVLVFIKKAWSILSGQQFNKRLVITEIAGLSDIDNMKDLGFEVKPTLQGLVGSCYNERIIKYEEDVTGLDSLYNLTAFQISKTRHTKFCLCVPIFNKDDKVVTVISMDSIYSISIPQEKEESVANMITVFVQDFSKYFPELFK